MSIYVMLDIEKIPWYVKLVKNDFRLHDVVQNHTYIQNRSRLEKKIQTLCINLIFGNCYCVAGLRCYQTTYLEHSILNSLT